MQVQVSSLASEYPGLSLGLGVALLVFLLLHRWMTPPSNLRHIPCVPVWSLLYSYCRAEVEEQRIRHIILPFANRVQSDVVLVWTFGTWWVHIVEAKTARIMMDNRQLTKQEPPKDMMFWRLTGGNNIFFSNGERWQKHSKIFRDALHRTAPMEQFAALSKKICNIIGEGGRVKWNNLTHRFTLDAVGTTVLGYDFRSLDEPENSFIQQYHHVMKAVSNPLYCFLPILEHIVPRRTVLRDVESLVERFRQVMNSKRKNPGNDVITFMLDEPDMTDQELRDNMVVMFMAGHDTTAGALSTLVYYLGMYSDIQSRVRGEVLSVVGPKGDLQMEHFNRMPYLRAVIKESLRINTPSLITLPRTADIPVRVGEYVIPPNTPVTLNNCAVLMNESLWDSPETFNPDRFMDDKADDGSWIPFGSGFRSCPARNFSLVEQRVLISTLIREFSWTIPEDSIHLKGVRNEFSVFALSLPYDMDINFHKI